MNKSFELSYLNVFEFPADFPHGGRDSQKWCHWLIVTNRKTWKRLATLWTSQWKGPMRDDGVRSSKVFTGGKMRETLQRKVSVRWELRMLFDDLQPQAGTVNSESEFETNQTPGRVQKCLERFEKNRVWMCWMMPFERCSLNGSGCLEWFKLSPHLRDVLERFFKLKRTLLLLDERALLELSSEPIDSMGSRWSPDWQIGTGKWPNEDR